MRTSFSIPGRTARTRPRAMRCGPAARCSRATARRSRAASRRASCAPWACPELVADDERDFVERAVRLAGDPDERSRLRVHLAGPGRMPARCSTLPRPPAPSRPRTGRWPRSSAPAGARRSGSATTARPIPPTAWRRRPTTWPQPEEASNPCPPKRRPARRPRFPATASIATPSSPNCCTQFVRDLPAALSSIESIGKSHEGRDIWRADRHQHGDRARRPTSRRSGSTATSTRPRSRRRGEPVLPRPRWCATTVRDPTRSRARSTRGRSTSARESIPTAPNGRSPTSRSGSARARGRTRSTRRRSRASTVEDIDGDGRILQMRMPDANGLWKEHPEAPRPHDPPRAHRNRRHVLPRPARRARSRATTASRCGSSGTAQGLDLNRNFPASWRQEFEQLGAGPVSDVGAGGARGRRLHRPASEHHAAARRSTPGAACCCGRSSTCPTTRCTPRTCGSTAAPATRATELTGYPAISVYHDFRYHPKQVIGGTFDWIYEHLGIFSWVVEIWIADARGGHRATTSTSTGSATIRRGRRPQALPLERRRRSAGSRTCRGGRSTTRSSATSRSAAGTASTRSRIRRRSSWSASSRAFRAGSCGRR